MESKLRGAGTKARVKGSGAAATQGAIAAGEGGIAMESAESVTIFNIRSYMNDKGPRTAQGMGDPAKFWDKALERTIEVERLRDMLLSADEQQVEAFRDKPARLASVSGLLYPSSLMVAGFWESHFERIEGLEWRNGIQQWLFQGFHSWGPSFDYSWDFEGQAGGEKGACVAQLGAGDEANSIPVIIPPDKARKLDEVFRENGRRIRAPVAPLVVTVDAALCHRSQCPAAVQGKVGGILDYCLWLKEDERAHKIAVEGRIADMYSAYLWKCLVPKDVMALGSPRLNDAYFVWEHTNLANEDSVKYNLDSLEYKVAYLEKLHGAELVLLQKSSVLVRGEPRWSKQEFYNYFLNRKDV